MARLNNLIDSDEEFPSPTKLLNSSRTAKRGEPSRSTGSPKKEQGKDGIPKEASGKKDSPTCSLDEIQLSKSPRKISRVARNEPQARKQKSLKVAPINSLLHPLPSNSFGPLSKEIFQTEQDSTEPPRMTPGRNAKKNVDFKKFASDLRNRLDSDEERSFDDPSDFIEGDSASDLEPSRLFKKKYRKIPKKAAEGDDANRKSEQSEPPEQKKQEPIMIDLTSPRKPSEHTLEIDPGKSKDSSPGGNVGSEDLFSEDPFATLKFSPPRSRSPHKISKQTNFITPPSSPSKPRLQSPSKLPRIPTSPHRPSIDAFWSQDVINDWNDQYSPQKTPKFKQNKQIFSTSEDDQSDGSPCGSPKKSPIKSPTKRDKTVVAKQKAFNEKKHSLAASFLQEIDQTVANGQVAALAASTGGIHIAWSKTLNTTAGRAKWKRETIKEQNPDGQAPKITYKHHASIELAEKVIDDEDRLLNTIAHEYCHLANYMISGIKDKPHGKEFKQWAQTLTRAFSHLNIHVTTKHSYAIAYKYIWACRGSGSGTTPSSSPGCGTEYKRHSKSIDPSRHRCGKCKGGLVQVQPAPRTRGGGVGGGDGDRYRVFLKENWERARGVVEAEGKGEGDGDGKGKGRGNREVMRVLGEWWRGEKEKEKEKEKERGRGEGREEVEVVEVVDDEGDEAAGVGLGEVVEGVGALDLNSNTED